MSDEAPKDSILKRALIKLGRPPVYDPEFHIPDMLRLAEEKGAMVHDLCASWGIDESSFYRWTRGHAEFYHAYKVAKMFKKAWWFDQARQGLHKTKGESFNATAWSMCMRNMGVSTDERKLEFDLEDCDAAEGIKRIKRGVSRGEITAKEAKTLVEMFVAEQSLKNSVYTGNEMEAHVSALEEKLKENAGKT